MSTITDFPSEGPKGRPPSYPWEEWADGQVRALKQGEDFSASIPSFRALVHHTAASRRRRGEPRSKAKTTTRGDTIIIQFMEEDQ